MDKAENECHYDALKDFLKSKGWKEQSCGETYFNGTFGTNFVKDGEVIHLSYDTWPDEEDLDDMEGDDDETEISEG